MKTPNPQFDIYPDLDRQIEITVGQPANNAMQAVVAAELPTAEPEIEWPTDLKEIEDWASVELKLALQGWQGYRTDGFDVPRSRTGLALEHKDGIVEHMIRLHEQLANLRDSGAIDTKSNLVADSMHVVLVPWQLFYDNLYNLEELLSGLRDKQGVEPGNIAELLMDSLKDGGKIYRQPGLPEAMLTAKEYLDWKIQQDGPWGIMLMQDEGQAGILPSQNASFNDLTDSGLSHYSIGGVRVDAMGIFEWLAMTLQMSKGELENLPDTNSILLANRIPASSPGEAFVPLGFIHDGQPELAFVDAFHKAGTTSPRLAIA